MKRWIAPTVLTVLLAGVVTQPGAWSRALGWAFPGQKELLYPRADLVTLVVEHLILVIVSSTAAAAVGIVLGLVLTRPSARFLRSVGDRAAALGQTLPPAAVLALAVPLLGFGWAPTVLGLFLYSTLPILRGTLSGLDQVPEATMDAAVGLGMDRSEVLRRVELPLAWPYLWAGLRTSVVVNVGTAALGATIGAGGLGAPIISGLVTQNYAFLWEGSLTVALLAITIDAWFGAGEARSWEPRR